MAFVGAPRFHDGGLPGLSPGEVPIIARKGEEVLSRQDPRNVLNGGRKPAGKPQTNLQIINTIDAESMLEAALSGESGVQQVVNLIRSRCEAIRTILSS